MKKALLLPLLAVFVVGMTATQASAGFVDDFNDISGWSVSYLGTAGGWDYDLDNDALRVTDINDTSAVAGTWANIRLTRGVAATTDFAADLRISWESSQWTVERLRVSLIGTNGEVVAAALFYDDYTDRHEDHASLLFAGDAPPNYHYAVPASDSAHITMTRENGVVTTTWEGNQWSYFEGTWPNIWNCVGSSLTPVTEIRIDFEHDKQTYDSNNPYNWYEWHTTVGTMTVDSISFQAVPEPASLSLLGLGGIAILRRRKRSAC